MKGVERCQDPDLKGTGGPKLSKIYQKPSHFSIIAIQNKAYFGILTSGSILVPYCYNGNN